MDAGKVGNNMTLLQKIMKIFRPVIQPIAKKMDNVLKYLFPEIRTWFVRFIDHMPLVSNLLRKCTGKKLLDGNTELVKSGSFFKACKYDFIRIIKKIIIKVGYFVLSHQSIKHFCLLIISKCPHLYSILRTIIYRTDTKYDKIIIFSELNEREKYIFFKIGGMNK